MLIMLFQIAVQLKVMTDELPKDIQEDTRVALIKLFQETPVFLVNRESFRAICASILVKNNQLFPTGWHQIALIYYGQFLKVLINVYATGTYLTILNA